MLEPHRDRITWDAPIHSWADVEALPFPPQVPELKPSRFGTLERLLEFYERCEEHGIALYGGGQFELGVGRGQIQVLAVALLRRRARTTSRPAATTRTSRGPASRRARSSRSPSRSGSGAASASLQTMRRLRSRRSRGRAARVAPARPRPGTTPPACSSPPPTPDKALGGKVGQGQAQTRRPLQVVHLHEGARR